MAKKDFSRTDAIQKGIIWPYADYSKGAKDLAREMKMVRVKHHDFIMIQVTQIPSNVVLINWGAFSVPSLVFTPGHQMVAINSNGVKECADKVLFFEMMQGKARVPETTTSLETAMKWLGDGGTVFGRSRRGSGGKDICFFDTDPEKFSGSDFYSLYKKKKDEFRVHIVDKEVILIQKKAVRDTDDYGNKIDKSHVNFQIRNHANGFIFKRFDISVPDDVVVQAKKAVDASGLDFGAVDVIYNESENKAYVLEVNTAPGLEGTTVTDYAKALKGLVQKRLDSL